MIRCVNAMFQSLDWVERLSDVDAHIASLAVQPWFQSLDWVERLSDIDLEDHFAVSEEVSIPRLG